METHEFRVSAVRGTQATSLPGSSASRVPARGRLHLPRPRIRIRKMGCRPGAPGRASGARAPTLTELSPSARRSGSYRWPARADTSVRRSCEKRLPAMASARRPRPAGGRPACAPRSPARPGLAARPRLLGPAPVTGELPTCAPQVRPRPGVGLRGAAWAHLASPRPARGGRGDARSWAASRSADPPAAGARVGAAGRRS